MSKRNDSQHDVETKQNSSMNEERRRFLLTTTGVLGGVAALCAVTPLISSWLPNAKTQADNAPITVDLSKMKPGEQMVLEWQRKPLWIIRRTQEMLQQLNENQLLLRDPDSLVEQQPAYAQNSYRSINPEYLVLIGVCTHLGCTPKYKPDHKALGPEWSGGFFCPCHGSTFDLAGRVFKGVPAPVNMEVPPYHFINEHTLVIGEDAQ